MKISLCMICGTPGKDLDRCLENIQDHVDEIIIAVSPDSYDSFLEQKKGDSKFKILKQPRVCFEPLQKEHVDFMRGFGVDPDPKYQVFRFDLARRQSFKEATGDWILWLDDDDIVDNPSLIRPTLEIVDPRVDAVSVNYAYRIDRHGRSLADHWRTRIIRNGSDFKWLGRIHEDLISETNAPMTQTYDFNVLHLCNDDRNEKAIQRNLIALLKALHDEDVPDPRVMYYLGMTMFDFGLTAEGISMLEEYIPVSGWDEQRYDALCWIGQKWHDIGDTNKSVNAYMRALDERADFPMAYFGLGKVYLENERFEKAIHWLEMGLSKPYPQTSLMVNPRSLDLLPLMYLSEAYYRLGKIRKALSTYKKAKEIYPSDEKDPILEEYESAVEQVELSKSFIKIEKHLEKLGELDKSKSLLKALPSSIEDSGAMIKLKHRVMGPMQWNDRTIAIYCPFSWEEWGPWSLEDGIGGSEEAVIRMSKEFTKKGYRVVVYANPGENKGEYDGVLYLNENEINFADTFDIFIGWRTPSIFREFNVKAKRKYLWLHDVVNPGEFTIETIDQITKVICLSKYHRELFPRIPEDQIMYSANGIDITEIKNVKIKRDPHKFVWTSCPSRGLENVLDWWPDIKKEIPDATLEVYYGFGNFKKGNANIPSRMAWVKEMMKKLDQPGVTFHGRKSHKEVAKAMLGSGLWVYPTIFPEISCITAMKAQAYGAWPITTGYAALAETQQFGEKIKLDKDLFLKEIKKYKDKEDRQEMIDWARKEFSWSKVADQWIGDFNLEPDWTFRIWWLRKNAEGNIVDIGGNKGHTFGKGHPEVVVVDIDKYDIPNFVQADAAKLPFKDKIFDTAVLSEILEHVPDPVKCLKEAKRVAKKIVITVPNEYEWSKDFYPFEKMEDKKKHEDNFDEEVRKANPGAEFYDDGYEHLFHQRFYTKETLIADLESAGITDYKITKIRNGGLAWFGVEQRNDVDMVL